MAKKKENLKSETPEELKKMLAELRESARILRFKAEGARPKNVKEFSSLRKKAARILTRLNEVKKAEAGK